MLSIFRYLVFGLFVISNSIICIVAVWNLSLAQSAGQTLQVDAYLIFLGAFALFFIFTVIFTEILRKNAITGRLWFETLWVGLFWIMELSGAAALTAIVPNISCDHQSTTCSSTRARLAFSWIITMTLLVYLVYLLCAAIIRQQRDPQIWHASVKEICRSPSSRQSLGSAPASPSLPRFQKEIPDVVAPQPRLPPPTAINVYRSGQGPEYDIGHPQRPSSPAAVRPVPPIPVAAPPSRLLTRAAARQSAVPVPSLYPQHLQSSVTRPPQPSQPSPASPPPLGDWPRADAVEQPLRSVRKLPRATASGPASSTTTGPHPPSETASSALPSSRSRLPGSRTTSGSREIRRPPPLNLTKISAFRSTPR